MATMIPSAPRKSEDPLDILLFDALKKGLDKDYIVYHQYRWTSKLDQEFEGQSDFLIYHKDKGLLVLGYWGNHLQFNNGYWQAINLKNSTEQILDPDPLTKTNISRKGIYKSLRKHLAAWPHDDLLVGALVWFPEILIDRKSTLPENYHHMVVMDESSFNHVQSSIDAAFKYYHHALKHDLCTKAENALKQKLSLKFNILNDLRSHINYREDCFLAMTQQQMILMDFLEHQTEACIGGVAGSGKTLLAIEKANRLANKDRKVLLLCYNRLLCENMGQRISHPNIHIDTFHNFAASIVGHQSGFDLLEEAFIAHMDKNRDLGYHDLIIDEGQDFNYIWLKHLKKCFYKDSNIYTFFDLNQNLYDRNEFTQWVLESPCKLSLTKNCRNTVEINDFATKIIAPFCDTSKFSSSAINGDTKPIIIRTNAEKLLEELENTITESLQKYKYNLEDITILTAKGSKHSQIVSLSKIGPYEISTNRKKNQLQLSTIRKFKGLEAKVVVLIEVEPKRLNNTKDRAYQNLIYAGVTRATDHLIIIEIEE